jgi:hypothetical protein
MLTIWTESIFLQVDRDPLSDKQHTRTIRDQFNLHYISLPGFLPYCPICWSWGMFEWKCEVSSKDLYSRLYFGRGQKNFNWTLQVSLLKNGDTYYFIFKFKEVINKNESFYRRKKSSQNLLVFLPGNRK